jgi:hypothetical protein
MYSCGQIRITSSGKQENRGKADGLHAPEGSNPGDAWQVDQDTTGVCGQGMYSQG